MKQSFGKTLMSCFLAVTLMASVIAGAISVSVLHASADSVDNTEYAVFSEIWEEITSIPYISSNYSSSQLQNFYDYVNPKVADIEENSNYVVMVMHDDNTNKWSINLYQFYNFNYISSFAMLYAEYDNGIGYPDRTNGEVWLRAWFYYDGNTTASIGTNVNNLGLKNWSRSTTYSFNNYMGYLTTQDQAVSGRLCYSSKDIVRGDQGTWSCSKNLLYDHPEPPITEFELVKFTLGERSYLTVSNQYLLVSDLWAEHLYWKLFNDQGDLLDLTFHDLIEFPDGKSYINYEFTDEGDNSVYAYDITNLDWAIIESSEMYDIPPSSTAVDVYAIAVNTPFNLQSEDHESDSYAQAWDTFYTYYNTYNTTHVIPEQLSDWIFDTDGAKLFPVSVQVPHTIWMDLYHSSDAPNNHVWRWGGLLAEEQGFQYSLFDTVIIGASNSGYTIRYFYSDTLDPMYQPIEFMALENVLDSFDVVIIVPDSDGYLNSIAQAYGFTGETGVVYVPDSAELVGNNWTGFAIVTEKAIAKQQLWNFNDGFSKLYKLEVDYIDSEDKWKDSFLLWSASIFDMLNSIDGRLNSILNSLTSLSSIVDQIRTTLNQIAADPDPDEVKPWYLSLWLFMKQFEPSNAQISEGLGYLVDNIDDIPLLPALTPVPALPTPGGG